MPRPKPSARARGLGAELRRIRQEHTKLSAAEAARQAGWDKALQSRLERGERNISPEEVAVLLAIYEYPLDQRERLLAYARSPDEPGWWEVGLGGLPKAPRTLASYENDARRIVNYEPLLLPGLSQFGGYSRKYMEQDGLPPAEVELQLTARARRQQVLDRPDLEFTALIGEMALWQDVAPAPVMAAQMQKLLHDAQRPNVSVHVVPRRTRPHPGMTGGFMLLEFEQADPVVHLEMWRTAVFISDPDVTRDYPNAVDRLLGVALGATESLRLIADVAEAWKAGSDDELGKREMEDI